MCEGGGPYPLANLDGGGGPIRCDTGSLIRSVEFLSVDNRAIL